MFGICDNLFPHAFSVSDGHTVGVLRCLLWQHRGVVPPHDNGNATCPVICGDLIGAACRECLNSHRDQVSGNGHKGLHPLINQRRCDVKRSASPENGKHQGLHGISRWAASKVGADECDVLHLTEAPILDAAPCRRRWAGNVDPRARPRKRSGCETPWRVENAIAEADDCGFLRQNQKPQLQAPCDGPWQALPPPDAEMSAGHRPPRRSGWPRRRSSAFLER